jgi:hypothetical protein
MIIVKSSVVCDVCKEKSEEIETDYNDNEIKQFLQIKNGPFYALIIQLDKPWKIVDTKIVCGECQNKSN